MADARPWFAEFACAGTSAVMAIICTNPVDVVKTRMQVQGQLGQGKVMYRGVFSGLHQIWMTEGLRGLQRGIGASCLWQFSNVSVRFGVYGAAKQYAQLDSSASPVLRYFSSLGIAAVSGALAAFASNPFFILKSRFQAASMPNSALHGSSTSGRPPSVVSAFLAIGKADGLAGYYRGISAFAPRVIVASAVQLSTYDTVKQQLMSRFVLSDGVFTHLSASLITGVAVVGAMQPFDFAATRLVSTPTAAEAGAQATFSGPLDVIRKSIQAEGVLSVYKGVSANYARFGPYCVLVFLFLEQLRAAEIRLRKWRYAQIAQR